MKVDWKGRHFRRAPGSRVERTNQCSPLVKPTGGFCDEASVWCRVAEPAPTTRGLKLGRLQRLGYRVRGPEDLPDAAGIEISPGQLPNGETGLELEPADDVETPDQAVEDADERSQLTR